MLMKINRKRQLRGERNETEDRKNEVILNALCAYRDELVLTQNIEDPDVIAMIVDLNEEIEETIFKLK